MYNNINKAANNSKQTYKYVLKIVKLIFLQYRPYKKYNIFNVMFCLSVWLYCLINMKFNQVQKQAFYVTFGLCGSFYLH